VTTPVPDADAAEQRRSAAGEDAADAPTPTVGADAPEADVVEQSQPATPGSTTLRHDVPFEADDADAAEQSVAVPLDDDEDRE
jgi:hypothetical protein